MKIIMIPAPTVDNARQPVRESFYMARAENLADFIIVPGGDGKNTGPGLALVREILDITGITIQETGEPGKGAGSEISMPEGMWRIGNGKK